ncbi:MAG TPA: amidohydrolase family protein [Acidobacteriota bacterium]
MTTLKPYQDHIQMWQKELRDWVPNRIFDAHIHLGPAAAMGPITPQRRKEALCTFTSFDFEELFAFYERLFSGKKITGLLAFPFPLREVNYQLANEYVAQLTQKDRRVRGLILSNPYNTRETIREYESARKSGIRYVGVKPYYDLVGKAIPHSVLHTSIAEFVPEDLLEFMNSESLILMLHTGRIGMGDPECQQWVRQTAHNYPRIRIILAHMGRYYQEDQFEAFIKTDVLDSPSVYLETSSASLPNVYRLTLARPELRKRLLFGSDLPFGAITGVEYSDENTVSTFLTRDTYDWTDPEIEIKFQRERMRLTYNVYHVIRALKTAIDELDLLEADKLKLKQNVFLENAMDMLSEGNSESRVPRALR